MSIDSKPLTQFYTRGFRRFRSYYTSSDQMDEIADSVAMRQARRQQGGDEPFYSGYGYYFSPSQHPVVMQQMNNAANQLVTETVTRTPWTELIPSFTDLSRMWVRSVQGQWNNWRPFRRQRNEGRNVKMMGGGLARRLYRWI